MSTAHRDRCDQSDVNCAYALQALPASEVAAAEAHICSCPVCRRFFFSSRRRHTRCLSDWSSDVCSSDLRRDTRRGSLQESRLHRRQPVGGLRSAAPGYHYTLDHLLSLEPPASAGNQLDRPRSEEHTSELQSLRHLVCRLLLAKKNRRDSR